MEKTSASAKERISMVSISITKERNIYFEAHVQNQFFAK